MRTKRHFTQPQREVLYQRANGKCQLCGTKLIRGWEADHVIPYSRGGSTTLDNGQALCKDCNQKKGSTVSWRFPLSPPVRFASHPLHLLEQKEAVEVVCEELGESVQWSLWIHAEMFRVEAIKSTTFLVTNDADKKVVQEMIALFPGIPNVKISSKRTDLGDMVVVVNSDPLPLAQYVVVCKSDPGMTNDLVLSHLLSSFSNVNPELVKDIYDSTVGRQRELVEEDKTLRTEIKRQIGIVCTREGKEIQEIYNELKAITGKTQPEEDVLGLRRRLEILKNWHVRK